MGSVAPIPSGSAAPSATPAGVVTTGAAPSSSAGTPTGEVPAPSAPGSVEAASDDSGLNITLGDTAIQTEADFPSDLSDEERESIGTGKVPIHKTGRYRSPFANPSFGSPATAKVGLVISEVRGYDLQTGSFEADFFLSLTSDKPMPRLHPQFTNGREVECKPLTDAPTFRFYRCGGTFTSSVDLRKYPFDTQYLTINFEDTVYGVDTILFQPDPQRTSLDAGFRLTGYAAASVGADAFRHKYPPRFDRDDLYVSRYRFTLGLERFATSAAFSVYVPAFIIVLISLFGLFVPANELEVRSNAGAPMLAAAVLFHYSLIQSLPATGYLTAADKLMLGVYFCLLINIASTWWFLVIDEEKLDKAFRFFRVWVPVLSGLIMVGAVVL